MLPAMVFSMKLCFNSVKNSPWKKHIFYLSFLKIHSTSRRVLSGLVLSALAFPEACDGLSSQKENLRIKLKTKPQ